MSDEVVSEAPTTIETNDVAESKGNADEKK